MVFPILFLWGVLAMFILLKHLSSSDLDQGRIKTIFDKLQSSLKWFSLLASRYFDTLSQNRKVPVTFSHSTKFIFCHWSSNSDSMDCGVPISKHRGMMLSLILLKQFSGAIEDIFRRTSTFLGRWDCSSLTRCTTNFTRIFLIPISVSTFMTPLVRRIRTRS